MAKTLSYINSTPRTEKQQRTEADLRRHISELERELDQVKKTSVTTTKRIADLQDKTDFPNVVII